MSIRTRLTFWYTGLLAISLLVFDVLVYSALSGILMSGMDDRLAAQAQDVVKVIKTENDPLAILLSGRVQLPSIDVFGSQYYIQISQLDGQVVQLSDNLRGQPLPLPPVRPASKPSVPPALATSRGPGSQGGQVGSSQANSEDASAWRWGTVTTTTDRGVRLRVTSQPIVLAGRLIGVVQVAQSQAATDYALDAVRRVLLVASISLLLLAAVGGAFLARTALQPIEAITQTAQRITQTQDLGQRIPATVPTDELGQLTETINSMLGRLDELFQAQQRLVADVSHELRTPLTTIQGNVDLLRRGAAADPSMHDDALRSIADETVRMRRLVDDLLLLAQADSGLELYRQPVEMDTLLLEVYRQAQVMAQGVTIRLGAEDQAMVFGDVDRLRQLLLNLVDNALKYTSVGSGEVTLTLHRAGGWVQVAVEDNGVGIASEELPHIFERFYRTDISRSRRGSGGAGLGLAIAKSIAEAHGGRIDVQSQPAKGSTFTLCLPEMGAARKA